MVVIITYLKSHAIDDDYYFSSESSEAQITELKKIKLRPKHITQTYK